MDGGVRVRFAPSPTGFFHIGSARTALFNWLYAKHSGGKFILRIEDTDDERDRSEFLDVLMRGMRWLGIDWDEGPTVGGPCAPYFQSQRKEIYDERVEFLKKIGRAYEKDGAIYFKVSGEPQLIRDLIRGDVVRREEKDFVIVRSNGKPVFHLVNVIDDMLMRITHVIRGEDHLSNTSKHTELFGAFGVKPPLFAHIPLILKAHGPGKMSKRDSGALVEDYERDHFLPEAVRNYLCLLGWSPKEDREILPIGEIIRLFDIADVNKNNARFDEKKMAFFNGEYLRSLGADEFCRRSVEILGACGIDVAKFDGAYVCAALLLCQEKLRSLSELENFTEYFFRENFSRDAQALEKLRAKYDIGARLREFKVSFEALDTVDEKSVEEALRKLSSANGIPSGEYIHSVRFALSGRSVGPGFFGLVSVLGRDTVLARLDNFIGAEKM
ncbi:MAG: glutamate--tRNA ligase [Puniceicoccales bacterium]|jgi:glutamyl-tRNA synthetase|nr:glutamate--tRNA ligase [Puniceicoccales bacterium]